MNNVFFRPWIGKHYGKTDNWFQTRLLILGESHYGTNPKPSWTNEEIGAYLKKGKPESPRFWTNTMQIITGKHHTELSKADRNSFWYSVSFYNYIQEPLEGPRIPPTSEMWRTAQIPFIKILDELEPKHIIVLGCRLWDNLPNENDIKGCVRWHQDIAGREAWIYPHSRGKGKAISTYVYHPSYFAVGFEEFSCFCRRFAKSSTMIFSFLLRMTP